MRFRILSVGRKHADPAAPLVADYLSRIAKFLPIEDRILPPERDDKLLPKMRKETAKVDLVVALDDAVAAGVGPRRAHPPRRRRHHPAEAA